MAVIHAERARADEHLREFARAIALVADRELARLAGLATLLAARIETDPARISDPVDDKQVGAILWDAETRPVATMFRTEPVPIEPLRDHVRKVVQEGRPHVSPLVRGDPGTPPLIAISIPIGDADKPPERVLSFLKPSGVLAGVLSEQNLPDGWVAAILDQDGRVVARSRAQEEFIGTNAVPAVLDALRARDEGTLRDVRRVDGVRSVIAFARAPMSGYAVAIGVPERVFIAPLWRMIAITLAIALPLITVAITLASIYARRITGAFLALAPGQITEDRPLRLREAETLAHRLFEAARQRDAALAELHQNAARLEIAQDVAGVGVIEWDLERGTGRLTPQASEILGLPGTKDELSWAEWEALLNPADRDRLAAAMQATADLGRTHALEYRVSTPLGERTISARGHMDRDGHGRPVRFLCAIRDVTEERRREAALAESEQRLGLAQAAGELGLFDYDIVARGEAWVDDRYREQFGLPPGASHSFEDWIATIHPEDRARVAARAAEALSGSATWDIEYRIVRPDGMVRWIAGKGRILHDEAGRAVRLIGINHDVTARRETDRELRRVNELLEAVGDNTPDQIYAKDPAGRIIFANRAMLAAYGRTAAEVIGRSQRELVTDPAQVEAIERTDRIVIEERKTVEVEETVTTGPHGTRRWLSTKAPMYSETGEIIGLVGVSHDITERKKTEEALAKSDARFRRIAAAIEDVFWMTDPGPPARVLYVSPAFARLWGRDPDELYRDMNVWMEAVHPDDRPKVERALEECLARGRHEIEYRIRRPDGTQRWVRDRSSVIVEGTQRRVVGLVHDISFEKDAAERRTLLVEELQHRVKNTLATVQALVASTARTAIDLDDFTEKFSDRIQSLAATHSLLLENDFRPVALSDLVRRELGHYDDPNASRVKVAGPFVTVGTQSAVALGMALHELVTNAVKYGALSNETGTVEVRWELRDERHLIIEWQERGGPAVERPTRRGFGSALIDRLLARQMKAEVETTYAPEGVSVRLDLPVYRRNMTRSPAQI